MIDQADTCDTLIKRQRDQIVTHSSHIESKYVTRSHISAWPDMLTC
jgi:hypothetical protein